MCIRVEYVREANYDWSLTYIYNSQFIDFLCQEESFVGAVEIKILWWKKYFRNFVTNSTMLVKNFIRISQVELRKAEENA